jgi:hypothetical protein
VKTKINIDDLNSPRFVSELTVLIPASEPLTAGLLQPPEEVTYKSTVQCLLYLSNDTYTSEWRNSLPVTTMVCNVVRFYDSVQLDITG